MSQVNFAAEFQRFPEVFDGSAFADELARLVEVKFATEPTQNVRRLVGGVAALFTGKANALRDATREACVVESDRAANALRVRIKSLEVELAAAKAKPVTVPQTPNSR